MEDFPILYRCAVIVTPMQPFLNWLIKTGNASNITLKKLHDDSNVFLVPSFEEVADVEKAVDDYIKANFAGIFTQELAEWCTEHELFPEITYSNFTEWFSLSVCTMIYDMV